MSSSTELVHTNVGLIARSAIHKMLERPQLPPVNIQVVEHEDEDSTRFARIAALIPCYNEQDSIAGVLDALLASTRLPEAILLVVNGTTDMTLDVIAPYLGRHTRTVQGVQFQTEIFVHDMGAVKGKVNALNEGYRLISRGNFDFVIGIDGDTEIAPDCIEWLEREAVADSRIGGISALYTVAYKGGPMARFLQAGQRASFAGASLDNLLRNRGARNMSVLGGQASLFRVEALEAVKQQFKQSTVWQLDSEIEDSLLSIQIKDAGYKTKLSAHAYATVGSMDNSRSLAAQQRKWLAGGLELLRDAPFHPNNRLRIYELVSSFTNIMNRVAFLFLLAGSLAIHAFVFSPIWLVPPVLSVLLNLRVAMSMKNRTATDVAFAVLLIPAEVYMWIRLSHFGLAVTQHFSATEKDNWSAQANAESGKGRMHLYPFAVALIMILGGVYTWLHLSYSAKSTALELGWPLVACATLFQACFMFRRVARRHRSFKV